MKNGVPIDLCGQKFNKLTVIESKGYKESPSGRKRFLWLCQCDCGNFVITTTDCLKRGKRKSCGCSSNHTTSLICQNRKIKDYKENEYCEKISFQHGYSRTRLYNIWQAMKSRCYNKNHKYYKDYGGRGIVVCEEWQHDFLKFREWSLRNGYQDNLTIDRIDNDANYEPNNCKWSTKKEQARNTRRVKMLEYKGVTKSISEWSEITGITTKALKNRIGKGWSAEKCIETPPKIIKRKS